MATVSETRARQGHPLRALHGAARPRAQGVREGLESANATLAGDVTLVYDDALTSREALLKDMVRGGFREQAPV